VKESSMAKNRTKSVENPIISLSLGLRASLLFPERIPPAIVATHEKQSIGSLVPGGEEPTSVGV
jgi:hypothetical protein